MPSPFPGMDPFLEGPDVFPDFHNRLTIYLSDALQSQLSPPYFASVNERTWIELSDRAIEPDVSVSRIARAAARGGAIAEASPRYHVAVAETPLPPRAIVISLAEEQRRQPFIELFTGRGQDRRLVTCIEILSPSNKARGREGCRLYLQKQTEILNSDVNLVEIDLLRGGDHITAVPRWAIEGRAGHFDYHVCVWNAEPVRDPVVYPAKLQEPLPEIAVPLLPGDRAVVVDLQAVFERVYDSGPYRVAVDYAGAVPPPPLAPTEAEWVQERLAHSQAAGDDGK